MPLLAVLAGLLAGCDGHPPGERSARAMLARHHWPAGGCEERPDRLPAAAARTDAELAQLFGPPTSISRFAFGRSVGEFRVGLHNVLHLPADAAVIVTERTWSDGKCRLTTWSVPRNGTGVVIDTLVWSSDLEF